MLKDFDDVKRYLSTKNINIKYIKKKQATGIRILDILI